MTEDELLDTGDLLLIIVVWEFDCPKVDMDKLSDGTVVWLNPWEAATKLTLKEDINVNVKSSNGAVIFALLIFELELKLNSFVFLCFVIFSPHLCPVKRL